MRRLCQIACTGLILCIGGLGFASESVASNGPSHHLGYILSADATQYRDDSLVPMRFSGGGGNIGLGWTFRRHRVQLAVNIGLGASYVTERMGNPGLVLPLWCQMSGYRLGFARWEHMTMHLGMFWRSRITQAMLYSWDDAHFYFLASHVAGPSARIEWPLPKNKKLIGAIYLPMLGIIGRPPAQRFVKQEIPNWDFLIVKPHENMELATFAIYRSVAADVGVMWEGKRSTMTFAYEFDFEYSNHPDTVYYLVHRLVFTQFIGIGGDS